jgi:hypothetical protein
MTVSFCIAFLKATLYSFPISKNVTKLYSKENNEANDCSHFNLDKLDSFIRNIDMIVSRFNLDKLDSFIRNIDMIRLIPKTT